MPRTPPVAPAGRVARPAGSGPTPPTAADETRRTGRGCQARLIASGVLALALLGAAAANAQRLWSVGEVTTRPLPPIEVGGVVASAATAGVDGPWTAETAAVQVEFDYLRLGMGYLELPLWDGSVIEAENAVFEDRGNGNFLWSGEVPGAGYESVLFTVQDGHLVGWFGAPGGPKYTVHAGPDGLGTLSVEIGPTGDWCGHGKVQREALHPDHNRREMTGAGIPKSVGATSTDTLDILVVFDDGAAAYWKRAGGIHLAIQSVGDYFNMVLRNSGLSTSARAIAVGWTPEAGSAPLERHRYPGFQYTIGSTELIATRTLDRIRLEKRADLVVVVEFPRTNLWRRGSADPIAFIVIPEVGQYGFGSDVSAPALSHGYTFAHELAARGGSRFGAVAIECSHGYGQDGSQW